MNPILVPIIFPLAAAVIAGLFGRRIKYLSEAVASAASLACLMTAASFFNIQTIYSLPWAGFGFDFTLRIYHFSTFVLCAIALFGLVVSVYSWAFMQDKPNKNWYYFNFLLALSMANGAVLADNLVVLLFFWEALLIPTYLFIALARGPQQDTKATAMKSFLINGVADLCLLGGVALTGLIAGSVDISYISMSKIPLTGWALTAYILMMIGASAKAGAMPFHTWIPDAAVDAQLPFMAYLPAALEKLLGIYLLARISLDIFPLNSSHAAMVTVMAIGAVTIVLAVMMALVQSDYKKLLSYHAISQVGYMMLGIGTGTPAGVAGGIFHMINHALYKSCLFLTGGSVERATGTTSLYSLGGLAKRMPVTAACFIIAAAAISGIPPLNGFFSKELIFHGTLEAGYPVFFLAAAVGAIFTLASFLKLGHAVYFGDCPKEREHTKESPWQMLLPMSALAALCLIFGFGAKLPLSLFIEPSLLGTYAEPQTHLWGFHFNKLLLATAAIIAAAGLNHYYGISKGGPKKATEHIAHAPVLGKIYDMAARRLFDPYEHALRLAFFMGRGLYIVDRVFDFFIDTLPCTIADFFSTVVAKTHSGFYSYYLAWSLLGIIVFTLIVSYSGALP